jgi:membrane AbrB-like protein
VRTCCLERVWPVATAASCGVAGGLAASRAGLEGGLIFGSVLGTAGATALLRRKVEMPEAVKTMVFLLIGAQIGMLVKREALGALRHALASAVVTSLLLIVTGVLIAYLLRAIGHGPQADMLATSPGALEALVGLAADYRYNPLEVAVFHLVRLLLVVLSIPLILRLL